MINQLSFIGRLLPLFLWLLPLGLLAQQKNDTLSSGNDTIRLPFAISHEKKLSNEDLLNKKEGFYVTGIPDLSFDPINGFGYGGEGFFYFNGKKTDPFFAYTPYRAELDISLFNTTRDERELNIKADIPFVFNSKWRLRGELAYEFSPNPLYFGIGESTLNGLSYYPDNDTSRGLVTNASYGDYESSLVDDNEYYNTFRIEESIINLSLEHSYFDGRVRLLIGGEAGWVNTSSFNGNSKLREDAEAHKALGFGRNFVTINQLGLIYDTRDLEPDPGNGIYTELTNELSLKALGSDFNFNKTAVHFNFYKKLFPSTFKKLVFAGRIGGGLTSGNAPFFEYEDVWTCDGSVEGMGGPTTIRGYKQSRFMARSMAFTNYELRYRFVQFKVLKQHLAFSAVPFFDAGGVWDSPERMTNLSNLRYSEGAGLRIAWNVNTILRFDYAVSKEDRQFFFSFDHAF
ncbi:MAG: Omp85 family outer membrane protein [Bacteroidia bacterium]